MFRSSPATCQGDAPEFHILGDDPERGSLGAVTPTEFEPHGDGNVCAAAVTYTLHEHVKEPTSSGSS